MEGQEYAHLAERWGSLMRVILNGNLRIEFLVLKKRLKYISVILDILTDNSVTLEHRVLEADIDFSKKNISR